jgi:H+/gluconate symporter-like permease
MKNDLQLILSGPESEAAMQDLAASVADAGITLTPRPLPPEAAAQHRVVDPVSVAALVVSIPAAVLAALDLADRIAKRRRAKALIETAGRIRIERRVEVWTVTADGTRSVADLDPDALLALIEKD